MKSKELIEIGGITITILGATFGAIPIKISIALIVFFVTILFRSIIKRFLSSKIELFCKKVAEKMRTDQLKEIYLDKLVQHLKITKQ